MPQEHHVLKCFSCETFQVHIVKKINKWQCKMCGAKQSVKRNYGKGSGKDCRNQVMKLNELRLSKEMSFESEDNLINEENLEEEFFKEQSVLSDGIERKSEEKENDSDDGLTSFALDSIETKKRMNEMPENNKSKKFCKELIENKIILREEEGISDDCKKTIAGTCSTQFKIKKLSKYTKYLDDEDNY